MRGPLVVVGDTLLDVDLVGEAGRLAPDAPVPVLDRLVEHPRPGGAGLAAVMGSRDGHEVVLVTPLAGDEPGRLLQGLLAGVRLVPVPYDGATPVKKRVRSAGQSLLRLDSGDPGGRIGEPPGAVAEVFADAGAVLVADYGRGTTASPWLRGLVAGLPRHVPVVWDPHPRGSKPVAGARLVTPNAAEAAAFAGRHGSEPGDTREGHAGGLAAVSRHAAGLVVALGAQAVAVTLGERGALLSYGDRTPVVTPARPVRAVDPCGAGDRFAVTVATGLGSGQVTTEAVQAAVEAAGEYVAAGGASAMFAQASPALPDRSGSLADLLARVRAAGGTVVATGGCFDLLHAGHVATLRAARQLGDFLVVCLNSDDSVRRLKGPSRPLVPAPDRARVLEALECVDAVVVFDEDTPVEALRRIRPQVWAKGGDYAGQDVPEAAALEEWGGQAVVLPYLDGRSTTGLVRAAAARSPAGDGPAARP